MHVAVAIFFSATISMIAMVQSAITILYITSLTASLVPRRGGGGERAPGTHCLRMRLIATEFRGDRVHTYTYVYW